MMQASVETTGTLGRRMEIQVPAQRVDQAIEERLKSMSRTVRLKGFRPGKVPVKVVKQQFGQQVRQEVLSSLLQSSFEEAVAEHKLNPAGGPRIEPITIEQGQDLKFRAIFEVYPDIELKGIESLEIDKPVAEVQPADVDAMLESLRKQRPEYSSVDRAAGQDDRVTVDFAGTIDGVAFDGGKGENVPVVIGGGRMLKDFEAGLVGVRAGEEKSISVEFPKDYQTAALAGKTAAFALKIRGVEEQKLPELDDEFCKAYGVFEGGVEQLRNEIEDNMRRELTETIRGRLKQQALDKLLAANPVEVPQALLESAVRDMQMDMGRQMGAKDVSQLPPPTQFVEPARRRVALGLIVNELIKSAGIQVDQARVVERIQTIASQYPDPEQVIRAYRENADALRQINGLVLEDQVVDWLMERAKVTEQSSSFKELMHFGA
jgi:trigger factor